MRVRILLCLVVFIWTSVATGHASPLTDFDRGRASIDLNYRFSQEFAIPYNDFSNFKDAKNALTDGSVTVGLGNRFALQYRYFNSESDPSVFELYDIDWGQRLELTSQEVNLLYRIDKNWQVYVGYVNNKGTQGLFIHDLTDPANHGKGSVTGPSKNTWQLGLVGSTSFADKWTGYVSGGAGKNFYSWEVGTSYAIDKNWELNVNYREIKAKKLSLPDLEITSSGGNIIFGAGDWTTDMEVKGLGIGITYKF